MKMMNSYKNTTPVKEYVTINGYVFDDKYHANQSKIKDGLRSALAFNSIVRQRLEYILEDQENSWKFKEVMQELDFCNNEILQIMKILEV